MAAPVNSAPAGHGSCRWWLVLAAVVTTAWLICGAQVAKHYCHAPVQPRRQAALVLLDREVVIESVFEVAEDGAAASSPTSAPTTGPADQPGVTGTQPVLAESLQAQAVDDATGAQPAPPSTPSMKQQLHAAVQAARLERQYGFEAAQHTTTDTPVEEPAPVPVSEPPVALQGQKPWVDPELEERLCRPFWRPGVESVAIVGNGPLAESSRRDISATNLTIRFNNLENWRPTEPIGVWVLRHDRLQRYQYWGLTAVPYWRVPAIINKTQALWFIGGEQTMVERIIRLNFPVAAQRNPVRVSYEPLAERFMSELRPWRDAAPSTGYLAIQFALHCAQPGTEIGLWGFNWSLEAWKGHAMTAEREMVQKLVDAGRLRVHPTPCAAHRSCESAITTPNKSNFNQASFKIHIQHPRSMQRQHPA